VRNAVPPTRRSVARALGEQLLSREQQDVWEKAAAFCVRHLPTLWTAGQPRQDAGGGWVVPIVLRYPDGYEGTLGEMAWSAERQQFTVLTDRAALSERARSIAAARPTHAPISPPPEAGA
jgi:hypothetical protein